MFKTTVSQDQIIRMLEVEAQNRGYSLEELRTLARTGDLHDPELRDLWLIWGDTPLEREHS